GARNYGPGRGNQPPPFRCDKEHQNVQQTCEQPTGVCKEVPVSPKPEIPAARQRNPRRERLLLVARRPEFVYRHPFAGEPKPLASRCAVVVPIELGMSAQYFQPAAYQERYKQKVEEVRRAQPERKVEHRRFRMSDMSRDELAAASSRRLSIALLYVDSFLSSFRVSAWIAPMLAWNVNHLMRSPDAGLPLSSPRAILLCLDCCNG